MKARQGLPALAIRLGAHVSVDNLTDPLHHLHLSGRSGGDISLATPAGGMAWVATGTNGENIIHSEGPARPDMACGDHPDRGAGVPRVRLSGRIYFDTTHKA